VSSDTDTIHVFRLGPPEKEPEKPAEQKKSTYIDQLYVLLSGIDVQSLFSIFGNIGGVR
jgi:hypothetical protein